jgi:tRNA G18 (ribose-2'-O)-methylase SpoU
VIVVDDPADPRIAAFVGLRDRELRVADGLFVAEGDLLIERALQAGYASRGVLIDATRTEPLPFVLPDGVPVFGATPVVLQRITGLGVHRGSLGVFERLDNRSIDSVLGGARRIAVLSRVMNPTNIGVIARSALALGIDGLLLDEDCSDPLYRRASRVAMGATFTLPYAFTRRLPDGLAPLHDAGFVTFALTPDPSACRLDRVPVPDGSLVAIVLGSEGDGLSTETLAECSHRVRIPISDRTDSLNVAAAAAVAFFHLASSNIA